MSRKRLILSAGTLPWVSGDQAAQALDDAVNTVQEEINTAAREGGGQIVAFSIAVTSPAVSDPHHEDWFPVLVVGALVEEEVADAAA